MPKSKMLLAIGAGAVALVAVAGIATYEMVKSGSVDRIATALERAKAAPPMGTTLKWDAMTKESGDVDLVKVELTAADGSYFRADDLKVSANSGGVTFIATDAQLRHGSIPGTAHFKTITVDHVPYAAGNISGASPASMVRALDGVDVNAAGIVIDGPDIPATMADSMHATLSGGRMTAVSVSKFASRSATPQFDDVAAASLTMTGFELAAFLEAEEKEAGGQAAKTALAFRGFGITDIDARDVLVDRVKIASVTFNGDPSDRSTVKMEGVASVDANADQMTTMGILNGGAATISVQSKKNGTNLRMAAQFDAKDVGELEVAVDLSDFPNPTVVASPTPPGFMRVDLRFFDKGGIGTAVKARGTDRDEIAQRASMHVGVMIRVMNLTDDMNLPSAIDDFISGKSKTLAFGIVSGDGKPMDYARLMNGTQSVHVVKVGGLSVD